MSLVDGWIDIHAHFRPPASADEAQSGLARLQSAGWCLDAAPTWNAERVLAYMDATGIRMQMLSFIPKVLTELKAANDFGAGLVRSHPGRFGLLAALPTDDPAAALAEISRSDTYGADGFAVTCRYNGAYLSEPGLDRVWAELNRRRAVVFVHPDGYASGRNRPAAVIEVAAETALTLTDMIYRRTIRDFPEVKFVVAHCGGGLPAMSSRLLLLGTEPWVPNPEAITVDDISAQLRALFLDTAGVMPAALGAALEMTNVDRLVYGSDCGVPCTSEKTMNANLRALLDYKKLSRAQIDSIGLNARTLFPIANARASAAV